PVALDQGPRGLVMEAPVRLTGHAKGVGEAGPEARGLDLAADRVEGPLDRVEQLTISRRQVARLRYLAEVPGRVGRRSVDEMPPRRDELVVVPPDNLGPGEVGVLRLGPSNRQEEAKRVGVVATQHVADVDDDIAARAEPLSLHGEVLARDDVVREDELSPAGAVLAALAIAEEDARPDHR